MKNKELIEAIKELTKEIKGLRATQPAPYQCPHVYPTPLYPYVTWTTIGGATGSNC